MPGVLLFVVSRKIGLKFSHCLFTIVQIDSIITPKHCHSLVARDRHDNANIHSRLSHIRDRCVAEIMKAESLYTSAFACPLKPPPKVTQEIPFFGGKEISFRISPLLPEEMISQKLPHQTAKRNLSPLAAFCFTIVKVDRPLFRSIIIEMDLLFSEVQYLTFPHP